MIHPVKKALNKAARQHMYGFLNEKQFPQNTGKNLGASFKGFKGPEKGSGGAAVPAKPTSPKPTGGRSAARV